MSSDCCVKCLEYIDRIRVLEKMLESNSSNLGNGDNGSGVNLSSSLHEYNDEENDNTKSTKQKGGSKRDYGWIDMNQSRLKNLFEKYNEEYFYRGVDGVSAFYRDYILRDSSGNLAYVYDPKQRTFLYRDSTGEQLQDCKCKNLLLNTEDILLKRLSKVYRSVINKIYSEISLTSSDSCDSEYDLEVDEVIVDQMKKSTKTNNTTNKSKSREQESVDDTQKCGDTQKCKDQNTITETQKCGETHQSVDSKDNDINRVVDIFCGIKNCIKKKKWHKNLSKVCQLA